MESLNNFIIEKLKLSKNQYTLFPDNSDELREMIYDEIVKNGPNCSLNHIDVSNIMDMYELFADRYDSQSKIICKFDGDISKWDVRNVKDMSTMFFGCEYTGTNGDISNWNVSSVLDMSYMFNKSKYNGNISNWDVSNVKDMIAMFRNSIFDARNGSIENWKPVKVTDRMMSDMFFKNPLENNPPAWYKK